MLIHLVYTGPESKTVVGDDERGLDGTDIGASLDRVVIVAQSKRGFNACVFGHPWRNLGHAVARAKDKLRRQRPMPMIGSLVLDAALVALEGMTGVFTKRLGGRVDVVYTGDESHRLLSTGGIDGIDGRDFGVAADRVVVMATTDEGTAGCIVVPPTECPAKSRPSDRVVEALREAVGYDLERLGVVLDVLEVRPTRCQQVPVSRCVTEAAETAIRRLFKHGPIKAPAEAGLRDVVYLALGGLDLSGTVYLHGDRHRQAHRVTPPISPVSSHRERRWLPGTKNELEQLRWLKQWFVAQGGRIIHHKTARDGIPEGVKRDGHRREIVVAVWPDDTAGASVWHVSERTLAWHNQVKRARATLKSMALGGLLVDVEPEYRPFNLLQNEGTAIRRAIDQGFALKIAGMTDLEIVRQVMGGDSPQVKGPISREADLSACPR